MIQNQVTIRTPEHFSKILSILFQAMMRTTILKYGFISLLSLYFIWYYHAKSDVHQRIIEYSNISEEIVTSRTPTILIWTKYFGSQWPTMKPLSCNCTLTTDRSHFNLASAIVFHLRDYDTSDIPVKYSDNPKYVVLNLEAPCNTYPKSDSFMRSIEITMDWTMTYRTDSDLFIPYGTLIKRKKQSNEKIFNYEFNHTMFESKTKDAAWFVSHCSTESKRENYVDELRKYIQVDIYGACGGHSCDRRIQNDCYKMVENEYKFYLSFENSICKDYITEKLYNILNYNVIPIVFGPSDDYEKIMPNHSFIDARKYSPKELASLMNYIASNLSLYSSFFDWKNDYIAQTYGWEEMFCILCQ